GGSARTPRKNSTSPPSRTRDSRTRSMCHAGWVICGIHRPSALCDLADVAVDNQHRGRVRLFGFDRRRGVHYFPLDKSLDKGKHTEGPTAWTTARAVA